MECKWKLHVKLQLENVLIVSFMFGIVFLSFFLSFSGNKIVSILLTIVVIAVNLYFVINQVEALSIEGGVLAVVCEY